MRDFDFIVSPAKLLTPEIVQMVSSIHEHKGKQELFLEANVDELKTLLEVALIQSTGASNRIEGIFTSDKRLEELVSQKAEPRNRSEQEIAGYREVLSTIHEGYEYINPRPNIILQLHRDLYSYSQGGAGGSYKNSDNVIAETDAEGHQKARFIPVPAFQTAEAMEELCARFLEAWEADRIDKLVLIPMFILDFLCIHPFNDGNGRMSRLLTLLLFYKAGYIVGKYVSMEMLIEKTKETYYEALQASSTGWHEGENSYEPFVKYYLGIMLKAYNEFESRVEHLKYHNLSKPDRIKAVIDNKVGKITKKEIMEVADRMKENESLGSTTDSYGSLGILTVRNHKQMFRTTDHCPERARAFIESVNNLSVADDLYSIVEIACELFEKATLDREQRESVEEVLDDMKEKNETAGYHSVAELREDIEVIETILNNGAHPAVLEKNFLKSRLLTLPDDFTEELLCDVE